MDYYTALGLQPDATHEEIKKKFRTLSRQFHPDVNPDNKNSEEKFKQINEAYTVLSDSNQRSQYDAQRHGTSASPLGSNFEGMFDHFFGRRQRRQRPQRQPPQNREKVINFQLTLSDLLKEGDLVMHLGFEEEKICQSCRGVGGKNRRECIPCEGHGMIEEIRRGHNIAMTSTQVCGACGGNGSTIEVPCTECRGDGTVTVRRRFKVTMNGEEI